MSKLFGTTGGVTFANGFATNVKKWEGSAKMDAEDTTDFAAATAGAKEFTPTGLEEWEGNILCIAEGSTATSADQIVHAGVTGSATLTMGTGKTLTGNIVVTEVKFGPVEPGKPVEIAQSFKGTGPYTIAQ
jgi:hypothetical protein